LALVDDGQCHSITKLIKKTLGEADYFHFEKILDKSVFFSIILTKAITSFLTSQNCGKKRKKKSMRE
jgi:hypothetical protein